MRAVAGVVARALCSWGAAPAIAKPRANPHLERAKKLRRPLLFALAASASALILVGCIIDDLDAVGRPCDPQGTPSCGPGTVCHRATQRCVAVVSEAAVVDLDAGAADAPTDQHADLQVDGLAPDVAIVDGAVPDTVVDAQQVACSTAARLAIGEVSVGGSDYVELINISATATDLADHVLVLSTADSTRTEPTVTSVLPSRAMPPGDVAYVFGAGGGAAGSDIQLAKTIPFAPQQAVSVLLRDPQGAVLDFVTIGGNHNVPAGITFFPAPLSEPAAFDGAKQGYLRVAYGGQCPTFKASDWQVGALTRL